MKPFEDFVNSLDNQTLDRVIGGIASDIEHDCQTSGMSDEEIQSVKSNIYPVRVTLGLLELYHNWLKEGESE